MKSFVLGLLLIAGCPHPTPAPAPPPPPTGYPACPATLVLPTPDDICDGIFTTDAHKYACVRCKGAGGCMDTTDVVYCVQGACLSDPHCAVPDGGTSQ